jgi:hypothetical protein
MRVIQHREMAVRTKPGGTDWMGVGWDSKYPFLAL